jgi:hypothetical protein
MLVGPKLFTLSNGAMTAEIGIDGRGYTAVAGVVRAWVALRDARGTAADRPHTQETT